MNAHEHGTHAPQTGDWYVLLFLVIPLVAYLVAAIRQRHVRRGWNIWRTLAFAAGLGILAVALSPLMTEYAHRDLRGHMAQHLLIGMFAPLGLVLSAPITLLLRSISVGAGRRVAAILRSPPGHLLSHPVAALILNVGGMYVLYLTPLYGVSLNLPWLHALIYLHFLGAGYLFIWAIAGPDPAPRRPGMTTRVVVLIAAMGTHAALGKLMYAHLWPRGTSFEPSEIQEAAMLMYYGGDFAELLLAIALFGTWYHRRRRDRRRAYNVALQRKKAPA